MVITHKLRSMYLIDWYNGIPNHNLIYVCQKFGFPDKQY